jgi:hypothetical protein
MVNPYKRLFFRHATKVLLWSWPMPRPRKNDPSSLINPVIEDFAHRLASIVERFTVSRIEQAVRQSGSSIQARRGRPAGAGSKRGKILCYYPGCKNIAAPRFGMFCAATHKDLPKAEKEKYRAQHAAKGNGAASGKKLAAKRGRKRGRPQATA